MLPAAYHSSKTSEEGPFSDGNLSDVFGSFLLGDDGMLPAHDPSRSGLLAISRGTAILLLFVYVGYLNFQVSTLLSTRKRVQLKHLDSFVHTLLSSSPRLTPMKSQRFLE